MKSTGNLQFSVGLYNVNGDLNQYKIVMPLFGALLRKQKIKSALKGTGKLLKDLEKSMKHIVNWDLNPYKIVMPLFGAA